MLQFVPIDVVPELYSPAVATIPAHPAVADTVPVVELEQHVTEMDKSPPIVVPSGNVVVAVVPVTNDEPP